MFRITEEQANMLYAALTDLVQRVDTTPIEDGSNLDTLSAHAVLERIRRSQGNPDFVPGKHCTRCRWRELPPVSLRDSEFKYTCTHCLPEVKRGMARSRAAKRAVQTKRNKYRTWPTRRGDHK